MQHHYIKNKGILVGTYNETDIANKKDKADVERYKQMTGLQYTNQEFVKKNGKIVGIRLYVCNIKDMHL